MGSRLVTVFLSVGLLFSLGLLAPKLAAFRGLGNQMEYEPAQPIAYSHRLHAGELQIPCLYCHSGAQKSRHAGIPSAGVCMNCHRFVAAPIGAIRAEAELSVEEGREPQRIVSPELAKLFGALGLDEATQPDPAKEERPIAWVRVHNLADFVFFDHRSHVAAGVVCQWCHGPVETMERMRQIGSLSMGWCVNCHREANRIGVGGREVHASLDCVTCHF